jgi:hypothetical protein
MIGRRALLTAAPGLALASPVFPIAARADDARVRGSRAYSESAMVMSVAQDGSSALTLRICRFPVEGFTWLWCHLLLEGRLYAFTRHDLPAGPERLSEATEAIYRAEGATAKLVRFRREARPPRVRLEADLGFHESRAAPHGQGPIKGRIKGLFMPVSTLETQVLDGREEVYGVCRAEVSIGGRTFGHVGLAKYHEQRQEAPRFEAPFNYAFLAGDGLNATTLLVARGALGGWQVDSRETPVADMTLEPPADHRRVAWRLAIGQIVGGRLDALVRYEIPVYDRRWQGSFVGGLYGDRPVVGAVNDWRTDVDIYAAAELRSQKL